MVLGRAPVLEGDEQAGRRCERITDHLMPGRWADARQPNRKELAATLVLVAAAGRVVGEGERRARPTTTEDDLDLPGLGRRPAAVTRATAAAARRPTCGAGPEPPDYLRDWTAR